MPTDQARNRLFCEVRRFSQETPVWGDALRTYSTMGERFDLTMVSQRMYGKRTETLVIQAAAGLDSPEQEMTERLLVLPTAAQLRAMKLAAGYAETELY